MSRNNGGIRDATIERARTDRMTAMHSCKDRRNKGSLRARKVQFFLTLFKKPLTPPLSFEHYVVNFSEGILTKVRKRLSRQLSTK